MTSKAIKSLGLFQKAGIFDKGIAARLPEAYKKFYKEWLLTEPTAVHYIPEEGVWKRNDATGVVTPVQNYPIPLKFPPEAKNQLWGGEGIVQGFQKRDPVTRRVPHFWVPTLHRTVVYSEVLNKHISVIATNRAIKLINSSYGFDHYLLKTPACDLKTLLPLKLKRKILQELQQGCPNSQNDPEKQSEILAKYQQYLNVYTPEEIEWYGYTLREACRKMQESIEEAKKVVPLKQVYRMQLIEKLKTVQMEEAKEGQVELSDTTSWIQKINPFGKKHET